MSRLKLLGNNIKKYRIAKGLTQENLAEMVDLSREYVIRVEMGHKRISLKKLFEIADALDVDCSMLINFK
jgi:transcriptional regulator with XRE-family HTH domain